jgi:hypothetical protein
MDMLQLPRMQNAGSPAQHSSTDFTPSGPHPSDTTPCTISHCAQARAPAATLIQQRLSIASSQSSAVELNELLRCCVSHRDARATVHVFHLLGSGSIDAASWDALKTLEQERTHREVFAVPVPARAQLAPLRRIHKICKGPRLHERSEMAKRVMPRVMEWLEARVGSGRKAMSNAQRLCGKRRRAQADALAKELGLRATCARGVVTKLKQKKLIW